MIILFLLATGLFWFVVAAIVLALLRPIIGPPIRWLDEKYCNWQSRRSLRRQDALAAQSRTIARL